jgi:hypothetical protein
VARFRPASLRSQVRGAGARSNPRARTQRLDVLIGILGFFTLTALLQAVVLEARGEPAGSAALLLAGLVLALVLAVRARRRSKV